MDALEPLTSRRSASRLAEPAPAGEQLQNTLRAGMCTSGHKSMQSWHFLVIEGEGHECFSAILEQGVIAAGSDNKVIDKARNASFRASLIITVVAKCEENHKVSRWEREMFVGYAAMAMQMAAVAQGFGGIWYSGTLTESPVVCEALGRHEQDKIVGFLYLGMPQLKASTSINVPDPTPFATYF